MATEHVQRLLYPNIPDVIFLWQECQAVFPDTPYATEPASYVVSASHIVFLGFLLLYCPSWSLVREL